MVKRGAANGTENGHAAGLALGAAKKTENGHAWPRYFQLVDRFVGDKEHLGYFLSSLPIVKLHKASHRFDPPGAQFNQTVIERVKRRLVSFAG